MRHCSSKTIWSMACTSPCPWIKSPEALRRSALGWAWLDSKLSTKVFQAWQEGHCPDHWGVWTPQSRLRKLRLVLAMKTRNYIIPHASPCFIIAWMKIVLFCALMLLMGMGQPLRAQSLQPAEIQIGVQHFQKQEWESCLRVLEPFLNVNLTLCSPIASTFSKSEKVTLKVGTPFSNKV